VVTSEVLSSIDALEEISEEWNQLYNDSSKATPFQSPFWTIPWLRNYDSKNLFTIVIRDEKNLIGLAPFYLYSNSNSQWIVSVVGTGISDYIDVLYTSEHRDIVMNQICTQLQKHTKLWECCDFQELPEGSLLFDIQKRLDQFQATMCKQSTCSFIETIPGAGLKNALPGKLRKNAKDYLNKIKADCTFQFETTDGPHELIRLHSKRWNNKNEQGVLDNPVIQKFHQDVYLNHYSKGNIYYFVLKIESIPVACYYVLTRKSNAYFYLSGFDPLYSRFSPGTVTLYLSIKNLFEKGITCFDFLRGNEAYKTYWGVKTKSNYRLQVFKTK
jgi:CelD/BcsL family acetyltransferase involved in cellulose biosynthesis